MTSVLSLFQASIRTLAVRVVRDMVKAQPYSFNELNGLVISEVLNLHQDEDKGVCLIMFTKILHCLLRFLPSIQETWSAWLTKILYCSRSECLVIVDGLSM